MKEDRLYEELRKMIERGEQIRDKDLIERLGMSKGSLYRAKQELQARGLIEMSMSSKRGGMEYRLGGKAGKKNIIVIEEIKRERERERERERVSGEVLEAWRANRGRSLIEREESELGEWEARLGTKRLIEIIEVAWDWCTAEHMSMHYLRLIVERETRGMGEKKVGGKKWETRPAKVTAPAKSTLNPLEYNLSNMNCYEADDPAAPWNDG